MSCFIFNHSGAMGDLLSSLNFVLQFLQYNNSSPVQATFNIPINIPFKQSSYLQGVNLPPQTGQFIASLLRLLGFKVTHQRKQQLPSGEYIDLDVFRSIPINVLGGDLREWYYQTYDKHLPKDFSRKIFQVQKNKDLELENKILLYRTSRWINPKIDWRALQRFKQHFIFIGFKHEHQKFCKQLFQLPFLQLKDGVDTAIKMISARGVIGNPCGLYVIAEALKVPRIFITSQWLSNTTRGPIVNLPVGGWFQVVRINQHLIPAVQALLEKPYV